MNDTTASQRVAFQLLAHDAPDYQLTRLSSHSKVMRGMVVEAIVGLGRGRHYRRIVGFQVRARDQEADAAMCLLKDLVTSWCAFGPAQPVELWPASETGYRQH